jgi:hypothetical protein
LACAEHAGKCVAIEWQDGLAAVPVVPAVRPGSNLSNIETFVLGAGVELPKTLQLPANRLKVLTPSDQFRFFALLLASDDKAATGLSRIGSRVFLELASPFLHGYGPLLETPEHRGPKWVG